MTEVSSRDIETMKSHWTTAGFADYYESQRLQEKLTKKQQSNSRKSQLVLKITDFSSTTENPIKTIKLT